MWSYVVLSLALWAGVASAVLSRGFWVEPHELLSWLGTGSFLAALSLGGSPGWLGRLVAAVLLWGAALVLLLVSLGVEPLPWSEIRLLLVAHAAVTACGVFARAGLRFLLRTHRRRRRARPAALRRAAAGRLR